MLMCNATEVNGDVISTRRKPHSAVEICDALLHVRFVQPVYDEHFVSWNQSPEQMDALWLTGWRHFEIKWFVAAVSVVRVRDRDRCPTGVLRGFR